MEKNTVKGQPVLFSLMMGILLIFLISAASAVGTIMELDDTGLMIAQAGGFLVMAIIVTLYMTRGKRTLAQFGFNGIDGSKAKEALYYVPLLIIALVQPVMGGINVELTAVEILVIVVFTLLVGFTEESVFRGIIRDKLKLKGPLFYIVFSSVLFGILHMANALNGSDMIHVILQVINALLLGFIFALLIETTNNILPLIAFHFIYDALAMISNENLDKEVLLVSILNILYLLYGIYLVYNLVRRRKTHTTINGQPVQGL